eukprot:4688411-Amphidinium_carterae.1
MMKLLLSAIGLQMFRSAAMKQLPCTIDIQQHSRNVCLHLDAAKSAPVRISQITQSTPHMGNTQWRNGFWVGVRHSHTGGHDLADSVPCFAGWGRLDMAGPSTIAASETPYLHCHESLDSSCCS